MIFFLLLNILFFNIEIFSADQRTSFLTPQGTATERPITQDDLIIEAFIVAQKDKNRKYADICLFGAAIGGLSSIIGISQFGANSFSIKSKDTINAIIKEKIKNIYERNIVSNIIFNIDKICAKKESKNKNLKKYIAVSFIFMISSGLLSKYFFEQAMKRFKNNLNLAWEPETINLWNTLFQIKKKELSKEDDKDFFNAMTSTEEEKKKINNRIQFFKKIIKINMLWQKINQLDLTQKEKRNIYIKIANLFLYNLP